MRQRPRALSLRQQAVTTETRSVTNFLSHTLSLYIHTIYKMLLIFLHLQSFCPSFIYTYTTFGLIIALASTGTYLRISPCFLFFLGFGRMPSGSVRSGFLALAPPTNLSHCTRSSTRLVPRSSTSSFSLVGLFLTPSISRTSCLHFVIFSGYPLSFGWFLFRLIVTPIWCSPLKCGTSRCWI